MTLKRSFSSFWLFIGAAALSAAWLLPNHYPPSSSFHMDAWSAIVLSVLGIAIIALSSENVAWHGLSVLTAALICLPWLQYGLGLLPFAGLSWLASTYLLGLLLALLAGGRWESLEPGRLADFLFLAIVSGAIFSVGLQLYQWLMLDGLDVWSMGQGFGRPFANFGQPNQLATLLLWALVGVGWAVLRRKIGFSTAVVCASYLLFGLALTASRTAWLAVSLLTLVSWVWRPLAGSKRVSWTVTILAVIFVAFVFAIGQLGAVVMVSPAEPVDVARIGTEARPAVWAMFCDAAIRHPFVGYGWGPISVAQVEVAVDHPVMSTVYSQSHNLFLDLVLWCGIPIGGAVSVYLVWWLYSRARKVSHPEEALMLLLILIVFNHAMLEFPLQYAYFLLPVGLMMGALEVRVGARPVWSSGRGLMVGLWLVAVILLGLAIRDFWRVERAYQVLRFEWAGYRLALPQQAPDLFLLDQWEGYLWLARLEHVDSMSEADIQRMRDLVRLYPSTGFFQKLATALALNNMPEEAQWWLRSACKIASTSQCNALKGSWAQQSKNNPKIAAVIWPVPNARERGGN